MKRPGVKERIVEAASRLFYFEGYNQTGINQIIEEAQVAKASMYQHFRSKEDIAVAYLQGRHGMWMGNLTDFIGSGQNASEKIIKCFDYLNHWLKEVDFRGCGWQNIICDLPANQNKIRDQATLHKNDVRDFIHKLLKNEERYSDEAASQLGDELLILMEGAIILSQIQKNEWPILAAKRAANRLLSI